MDDNANKKQACKVDSSNDVNPDPEKEGEIPEPFNMKDERVKKGFLFVVCSVAFPILLIASFVKALSIAIHSSQTDMWEPCLALQLCCIGYAVQ